MHFIDRHWKWDFVSGAKSSPQEETFLSYMFWQKILCITLLRKHPDFVGSGGPRTILHFFVPLAVALSTSSRLWLTVLCNKCFDFDLKLSSKNNLKSIMNKPWNTVVTPSNSTALQLNYGKNNLSQQQLKQDVSARRMSCSSTLQCWWGLEEKKLSPFPAWARQEEILVI